MSGVVQGGVVEVVGSNLAGSEIFTAYIGSVDISLCICIILKRNKTQPF